MHRHILVVDDDADIRHALCDVLQDEGYRAVCVENGQVALDHLRGSAELPCLIILDLTMPVMDGVEFRQHQMADPRMCDVPVVIITAGGLHKARQLSARDVLLKPIEVETVLERVERYC